MRTTAAATRSLAGVAMGVVGIFVPRSVVVVALPSFGTNIPNGEVVPCYEGAVGCYGDLCTGLGHRTCAGRLDMSIPLNEDLSPFGFDWRSAGFQWTVDLCQQDSDGDGYTNGQELGDPCCIWSIGNEPTLIGDGSSSFVPSHPGDALSSQPDGYVFPECVEGEAMAEEEEESTPFNEGEEGGYFDIIIKNYTIPRKVTTYVDFVFNLPEDLPGTIYIVGGMALVDQPRHLHHFVTEGCSRTFNESIVGVGLDYPPEGCGMSVGGGGWAPGRTMWDIPRDAAFPIGRDMGIVSLLINVHYTDGDLPYLNGANAIASDGIRVYYITEPRQRVVVPSLLINAGQGPDDMVVQPGKKRAFMSKTCTVVNRCKDGGEEYITAVMGMTCQQVVEGNLCVDEGLRVACAESCGLCEGPMKPSEFEVFEINYHGHIVAREMYATLTRGDGSMEKIDLRSRPVWNYNDQVGYKYDPYIKIRPGDKITTTCVFDTTARSDRTQINLSTYDEMCLNTMFAIFDSPSVSADDNDGLALSPYLSLVLRGFECTYDPSGDIWQGELGPNEDARDIEVTHPLAESACSFPVDANGTPLFNLRCFGNLIEDEFGICKKKTSAALKADALAGYTCIDEDGSMFENKDSNSGYTQEDCEVEGGTFLPYTCEEAEKWLLNVTVDRINAETADRQTREYVRKFWWEAKCCAGEEQRGICGSVFPDENLEPAGYFCQGGAYDNSDSNIETTVTEEECTSGGGSWNEYNCLRAQQFMNVIMSNEENANSEAAMERSQLFLDAWMPKCCEGETVTTNGDETYEEESGTTGPKILFTMTVSIGLILYSFLDKVL